MLYFVTGPYGRTEGYLNFILANFQISERGTNERKKFKKEEHS